MSSLLSFFYDYVEIPNIIVLYRVGGKKTQKIITIELTYLGWSMSREKLAANNHSSCEFFAIFNGYSERHVAMR